MIAGKSRVIRAKGVPEELYDSGGAAILARYGGRVLQPWQTVLVLSVVSALWLVVAVYFLGGPQLRA